MSTTAEEFFHAHFDRLHAYVLMRVGPHECEDLVGDILLRATEKLNQVKGDPAAWLFAVARSQVADHFRRAYRPGGTRGDGNMTVMNAGSEVFESRPAPARHTPLETLEAAEFNQRLRSKFVLLSEQERDVIALKFTEGMANIQIAEVLGVTPANLGVILHRALKRLREAMLEETPA